MRFCVQEKREKGEMRAVRFASVVAALMSAFRMDHQTGDPLEPPAKN
jgi:hypothetical protein